MLSAYSVIAILSIIGSSIAKEDGNSTSDSHGFYPNLILDSCTKRSLNFHLYNSSDTGIVFVKGQDVACQQHTSRNETYYSFFFDSCGIDWGTTVQVVVQKHDYYQTGHDPIFPLECSADLSEFEINVDQELTILANDTADDNATMTVRPTASMLLYSRGKKVNGKSVPMSQRVKMVLDLDSEYKSDFDIAARSCSALTIPLVEDFCPTDNALFPNFKRKAQGELETEFGAFRITKLDGSAVEMVFTCQLKICLGSCENIGCQKDGTNGRRKRRDVYLLGNENEVSHLRSKRETGPKYKDIIVGAKLKVTLKQIVTDDDPGDDICFDPNVFIGAVAGMAGALGATIVASLILKQKGKEMDQKSGKK